MTSTTDTEIRMLVRKIEAMRHELVSSIDETRYSLNDRLENIETILSSPKIVKMKFVATIGGAKYEVSFMQLKVSNKLPLSIKLVDKFGNPAAVEGAPAWSLTNTALANLVVSPDGMSAELSPLGPIGTFNVQVSADADLGEGVKTIFGELTIDLLSGEAVAIEIVPGAAIPIE